MPLACAAVPFPWFLLAQSLTVRTAIVTKCPTLVVLVSYRERLSNLSSSFSATTSAISFPSTPRWVVHRRLLVLLQSAVLALLIAAAEPETMRLVSFLVSTVFAARCNAYDIALRRIPPHSFPGDIGVLLTWGATARFPLDIAPGFLKLQRTGTLLNLQVWRPPYAYASILTICPGGYDHVRFTVLYNGGTRYSCRSGAERAKKDKDRGV